MQSKNSYFILEMEGTRVYMNYYPPISEGEQLKMSEITDVLDKNRIEGYSIKEINDRITEADGPIRFEISDQVALDYNESMDLKITPDGMYVIVRFYPPSKNGKRMSRQEIQSDLAYGKVVYGIMDSVIDAHLREPEYFKNIIIAMGVKPRQGKNGFITYNFNTDRKAKPRVNKDGTVDFHQLDNIAHIHKGDILAEMTPADMGDPGKNVFGVEVRPDRVAKVKFKYGKNIEVSPDGLKLISLVDGCATLEADKVFVANLYDIPEDVDNSTGDVTFNGGILVRGNVRTGFKLKADGNIEVFGVVEGAELEAGGDVILHRGVQGRGRCKIRAKGNLISKFVESATINVEGYVRADSILNSRVSAKNEIVVTGKGGSIIGGTVRSSVLIEATSIGTAMGAATGVEVGVDPSVRDRIKEIEHIIKDKTAEVEKLEQLVTSFRKKQDMGTLDKDKITMIGQMTKSIILGKTEIKSLKNEYQEKMLSLEENENARIKVIKDIYAGTTVIVSGETAVLRDTKSHCIFTKRNGQVECDIW